MEVMSSTSVLKLQLGIVVATAIIDTFIVVIFVQKFSVETSEETMSSMGTWFIIQLVMVCVFGAFMVGCGASWFSRVWQSHKANRVWPQRQRLFVVDAAILLSLQFVNMSLTVAPQVMGLAMDCPWFRDSISIMSFVRWTLINSILAWMCIMMRGMLWYRGKAVLPDPDHQLTIDAPWREQRNAHLPLVFIYVALEATVATKLAFRMHDHQANITSPQCLTYNYICAPTHGEQIVNILTIVLILVYAVYYVVLVILARRDHAKVPFVRYRVSYLYVQMHARHGIFIVVLLLVVSATLRFVYVTSCWSYIDIQFGLIPSQLAITVLVCVVVLLTAPCDESMSSLKQRWLLDVAWSEAARRDMLRERAVAVSRMAMVDRQKQDQTIGGMLTHLSLRRLSMASTEAAIRTALGAAPAQPANKETDPRVALLCMETLLKALYFCKMSYRLGMPDCPVTLEHGMSLYPDLTEHEMVVEPATDTRVFLAWGPSTVVVAFRGTVTRKNIITDIKAWSTPHLPKRTNAIGRTMKVHSGFYEAWTRGGFGTALVERVGELLSRCPAFVLPRVLFTGHSLGGALAVLASTDFVRKFPQYQTTVSVYTFGAPRVGNGPFAVEHRGAVPDCWSVVNNQDPIPRIPKGWFHGAGHRVVITPRGDLIIKPTTLEISVIYRSGGVAAHHRLPSYSLSLFALLRAQFDSGKKLDGGAMGVTELAQRMDIGQTLVLKYAGIKEIMDARARRLPMPVEVYMARHARKHGTGPGGVEGRVISGESLVSTDISISMDGDTEGRLGHLDGHPRSDAGENDVETAEEEVEVERSTREEDALTDRGTLMSLSRISLIHGL